MHHDEPQLGKIKFRKEAGLVTIYITGFLFYFHLALPTYVNSSFLNQFVSENLVGMIYTIGSVLAVIGFLLVPRILRRYGNYRSVMTLIFFQFWAILGLAYFKDALLIVPIFVIGTMLARLIAFSFDVFLESFSKDSETGGIRGAFLTISNAAYLISPLLAGFIIGESNYERIYFIAAFTLIPLAIIFHNNLKNFADPDYNHSKTLETTKKIFGDRNIRKILSSNLLLYFFYAWMVIYSPIYLNAHIGLTWPEIGIVFTVMLVPFVLLEIPLGKLADKLLGEKEILSIGFIILGISSILVSFTGSKSLIVWSALLFLTRVGASTVAIMNETYFFKKIDGEDSDILGFFRLVQPTAYIIAPILASALLYFIDFKWLFLVMGVIVLYGLRYSLTIEDTL